MAYFTKEYKEETLNFIDERLSDLHDIEYIMYGSDGGDFSEDVVNDRIATAGYDMMASWHSCGASKCVFNFEEYDDIVFKIPFCGCLYVEYDDDTDEYIIEDEICEFTCAGDDNVNQWDYCETEAKNYIKAVEAGLEDIFAPTEFIGYSHNVPIYISKNIKRGSGAFKPQNSERSMNAAVSIKSNTKYYEINDKYLAWYIDKHGETRANELISFLNDNYINDLHCANWRTDDNGDIKIIDYSSWND